MRILIIEDDKDLAQLTKLALEKENFTVDICLDGAEGLYYMQENMYDLVLLDRMLPSMDGTQVLKEARQSNISTPVIFLTALGELQDKVNGLNCGADDYMVKPFAFEELLARIRAMLRKREGRAQNRCQVANLTVAFDTRTVMRDSVPITLSSKEFSILEYLVNNQGIVLSRDRIEQHIWNYDYEGGSNVVDVYIRYLRKKIDDGFEPKLIHTVRGAGYVLKVPERTTQ